MKNSALYQVDAFTTEIFRGNPAGVCLLSVDSFPDDQFMQNIAMEMNLSETAFMVRDGEGYRLRWFTPETEVDFCGHATLSAAHILWQTKTVANGETIVFSTRSGNLSARMNGTRIELDFPALRVTEIPHVPEINDVLGIDPLFTGTDGRRYLLELGDPDQLRTMAPDFVRLKRIGRTAFMVTCPSDDPSYDFYSRFFAPAVGIDEDPVTGSAHSYLAPYWSDKLGKSILKARQCSKRGGEMECEVTGTDRVLLRGNAVTVFEMEMKNGDGR